jgi:4-hydroxy-2-oxoheptanedioate aldolase
MLDRYGDEIAAIVIGPYDLSFTMNMPAKFDAPEFQAAVKEVFDICLKRNKSVGIFCDNTAQAEKYRAMGANFLWMCTDDQIVKAGLRAIIAPLAKE